MATKAELEKELKELKAKLTQEAEKKAPERELKGVLSDKTEVANEEKKEENVKVSKVIDILNEPDEPIPQSYREITDRVLNHNFAIKIVSRKDIPAFSFILIVPPKYSDMPEAARALYKYDIRPKVITYAEAENGVRQWCETVWKSFLPETQSVIMMDRVADKVVTV